MSRPGGLRARQTLSVLWLSAVLGLLGIGLATTSSAAPLESPLSTFWYLLIPACALAYHASIDFEFRKEAISVVPAQLPLALGAVFIAPGLHLAARVIGSLVDSLAWRREDPVKAIFNGATAAFDVGAAVLAVHLAGRVSGPGPRLWLALFCGLLLAELVSNVAVHTVMWIIGARTAMRQMLQPLTLCVLSTLLFTALAIVAVSAVWTEPFALAVIAVLTGGIAAVYRGHRRMSAQQQVTENLYDFVKDLGPLDATGTAAITVLQHVRVLLHARHLDLAICAGDTRSWTHVVVSDEDGETTSHTAVAEEDLTTSVPRLHTATGPGDSDRMATPLTTSQGLIGILTASDRLGAVRGFDMGDLRLLETIGAELATALERGRLLEDLGRAATTDSLTLLPNLRETTRLIDELLQSGDVLVAAAAVDSFREVNDALGHEVGDSLLLEVARRLKETAPLSVVGRIGGGRFAIAVPADLAGHDPEMFGLDLRSSVEGTAQVGPVGTHIRLSVGVVRAPDHGLEASTLLRRAETAMHSAQAVHGGPVMWEPAYEVHGQRRLAVVTALREALQTGAIGLAFQPKLDSMTGAFTGAEALARWTHSALGPIRPDEFIPLAEASGLMGPLTSSMLRQALTACNGWQRRAPRAGVAVNVSADTVLDPTFVTEVEAILDACGTPPELLTLELTEGVVVGDPLLAEVRLGELRALGVRVSVDDFGTGYSSLTYLKGLSVDEVKIDKTFVDDVVRDAADRAVVRAVVDIAHTLGLRVVAEGVEEPEQHELLQALGVDEIQGYLHGRPMPAQDLSQWIRARQMAERL
jgi:diguanylate cyclase (GGDEF)-like protein